MPHRGLSNKGERVRLGHIVTAHDLQDGGEHDSAGPDAVLQLFDVRGFVDPSLSCIERNHQRGVKPAVRDFGAGARVCKDRRL